LVSALSKLRTELQEKEEILKQKKKSQSRIQAPVFKAGKD